MRKDSLGRGSLLCLPAADILIWQFAAPLLAVLMLFTLSLSSAHAADAVGKVLFSSGDATITRADGTRLQLNRKDLVYNNDRLSTGVGLIQVKFNDGGFMSLQNHSEMRIDDFRYEGSENGKESAIFSLLRGGLRALSGAIGHARPKRYQLRTTVATIGIRGTAYSALLCQQDCAPIYDGNLPDGLHAKTTEGTIFIKNNAGILDVPAGRAAFVPDISVIPSFTEFNPSFAAINSRAKGNVAVKQTMADKAAVLNTTSRSNTVSESTNGKQPSSVTQDIQSEIVPVKVAEGFERFVGRLDTTESFVAVDTSISSGVVDAGVSIERPHARVLQEAESLSQPTSAVVVNRSIPVSSVAPSATLEPFAAQATRVVPILPSVSESVSEVISNTNSLVLEPHSTIATPAAPGFGNNYSVPSRLSINPLQP